MSGVINLLNAKDVSIRPQQEFKIELVGIPWVDINQQHSFVLTK